jgi:hypothetical protein
MGTGDIVVNYYGPGEYEHYKGGHYNVIGLALWEAGYDKDDPLNEDSVSTYVVYKPLTPGSLLENRTEDFWLRNFISFNEQVTLDDGTVVPRFKFIPPPAPPAPEPGEHVIGTEHMIQDEPPHIEHPPTD